MAYLAGIGNLFSDMGDYLKIRMNSDGDESPERPKKETPPVSPPASDQPGVPPSPTTPPASPYGPVTSPPQLETPMQTPYGTTAPEEGPQEPPPPASPYGIPATPPPNPYGPVTPQMPPADQPDVSPCGIPLSKPPENPYGPLTAETEKTKPAEVPVLPPSVSSDPQVGIHIAEPDEEERAEGEGDSGSSGPFDADEWSLFWQSSLVICFACAVIGGFVSGLLGALVSICFSALILFPCYPFFVLSRLLWQKSKGAWIVAAVLLLGAPVSFLVMGGLTLLFGRFAAVARFFKIHCLVLLILTLLTSAIPNGCKAAREAAMDFGSAQGGLTPPYDELGPPPVEKTEPVASTEDPNVEVVAAPSEAAADQSALPENRGLLEGRLGRFKVEVPRGYQLTDQSASPKTKMILKYGPDCRITFLVSKLKEEWDRDAALQKKLAAIEERGATPKGVKLKHSAAIEWDGVAGYELQFEGKCDGKPTKRQDYTASKKKVLMTATMVVSDPAQYGQFEALRQCAFETLTFGPKPKKSAKKKAAPKKEKWKPTEEDWRQAEAAVDFVGVMKRGDALVALIGRDVVKLGDTISVQHKGHGYSFTVDHISEYELSLKPVEEPPEPKKVEDAPQGAE